MSEPLKAPKKSKYKIIALINGRDIFIMPTYRDSYDDICSQHINGKHFETVASFTKTSADVGLYILDEIKYECTRKESRLYTIAWIRRYIDLGYNALCSESLMNSAMNIAGEAKTILDRITAENKAPEFLKKVTARKDSLPQKVKKKRAKKYPDLKLTQFNIKVEDNTKCDFQEYCYENGLKPNEALKILLEAAKREDDNELISAQEIIRNRNLEISKLQNKLIDAENEHSRYYDKVNRNIVPHYIEREKSASEFTRDFCKLFLKENDRQIKYKTDGWVRYQGMHDSYNYPGDTNDINTMVFKFEAIARVNDDQDKLYIFGEDMEGNLLKFRYYNDRYSRYIGIPIDRYDNSDLKNLWYILFDRNKYGACSVVGSFPIPLMRDARKSLPMRLSKFPTLSERIRDFVIDEQKGICDEIKIRYTDPASKVLEKYEQALMQIPESSDPTFDSDEFENFDSIDSIEDIMSDEDMDVSKSNENQEISSTNEGTSYVDELIAIAEKQKKNK